jgi:8-oxo-dGTP pyrophosphatase MutT (NUDIX family)
MVLAQDKDVEEFTTADLRQRAQGVLASLESLESRVSGGGDVPAGRSDFELNPEMAALTKDEHKQPAAVLIPVIEEGFQASILFTQRTDEMPTHPGQISFPGGKMDAVDSNLVDTALREAHEEIGLEGRFIDTIGFLDDYVTSTGYRISPLVAVIRPGYTITPDNSEVADVFDVPLSFLMEPQNHEMHSREWRGTQRKYYAMPYENRFIWGATAGMLRNLYEWLYKLESST